MDTPLGFSLDLALEYLLRRFLRVIACSGLHAYI